MEIEKFEELREDEIRITVHLLGEALKSRDKFIEECRNCTCREACNRQWGAAATWLAAFLQVPWEALGWVVFPISFALVIFRKKSLYCSYCSFFYLFTCYFFFKLNKNYNFLFLGNMNSLKWTGMRDHSCMFCGSLPVLLASSMSQKHHIIWFGEYFCLATGNK